MPRIAIVNHDKCKPEKCGKECIKSCPPQLTGKKVIDIEDIGKVDKSLDKVVDKNIISKKVAKIYEDLCIGCNICVNRCPFDAIKIINLPEEKKEDIVFRYNENGFKLYRLPIMTKGRVMGLIGENGIGKTTIIDILSNNIRPNFEIFNKKIEVKDIINRFRGSVIQEYLKDLYNDKLKISIKTQKLKPSIKNPDEMVIDYIKSRIKEDDRTNKIIKELDLESLYEKKMGILSGGELQRLLCGVTMMSEANVYIFDEPSNFLDIKQRIIISKMIQELSNSNNYVLVIEHDMSMLDFIADDIYIIYGKPGGYGVVSNTLTTLEGLNMYMSGYIKTQNMRFRDEEYNLKVSDYGLDKDEIENHIYYEYEGKIIEYDKYKLSIDTNKLNKSTNILVLVGENGTGKTTYINYLSDKLGITVSMKDQNLDITKYYDKMNKKYPTVQELFYSKILKAYTSDIFKNDIIKPLEINELLGRPINVLSGGELQKVLIILCLGTEADIYLIDEPSANLDIEKRLKLTKILKRYFINNRKLGVIIEHDIMMCVALSQEQNSRMLMMKKVENNVKREYKVSDYMEFNVGINEFLKVLDVTMRTSGQSNRPRINKYRSQLDVEQRSNGKYYC